MALPPNFLEELRARTPLSSLIGRRVRLTRSGRNWKGCCPFHGEKTPSFYVYEDHFHCFGCGAHGDAISYAMQAEGGSFIEAVERLAAEAGLEVPKPSPQAAARERRARDLHDVLEAAASAFQRRLRLPEGAEALAYLRRRGLTEETIARFGLGWSGPGRGSLQADLKGEGIEPAMLVEAGLLREREEGGYGDLFFNRVMFPIRDRRGRMISFGGRTLGDGQPKYVNGPETALFRKRRNLYALDLAKEAVFRGARLVAVEGYMDVIALHQAGFGGAVAPLGTALTSEQMEELWRLSPEPVLCFDGDAAGSRAAARAAEAALPLVSVERSLRLATLPQGEDPDTLVAKRGPGAFQTVLDGARGLSDALYGLLTEGRPAATPEQRASLRTRLVAAAGAIPDKALASEYRRALLDRFFAASRRPAGRPAPLAPPRPALLAPAARRERARMLMAVTLQNPTLLPEVEEAFGLAELEDPALAKLRSAILAWFAEADALDSEALIAHLAKAGVGEIVAGLLKDPGLPEAARPGAQPAAALEAWWHFHGLLQGEEELLRARDEALADWQATNSPASHQRHVLLTAALAALRRGEAGDGPLG